MNSQMLIELNKEAAQRAQQSLLRRAVGLFQAVTASPFNSSNVTLIVDVSKWVPVADLALLKKNGVRGIIARIGEGVNDSEDPTWAYYVDEAYKADIPILGYYVIHPEYGTDTRSCVDAHLTRIKKFVANKQIYGIYIDAEITLDGRGMAIAPAWISERTRSLADETQRAFPNLMTGVYTGGWYVDGYGPAMKEWLYKPQYNVWWACYTYEAAAIELDWADLPSHYPTALPKNLIVDTTGKGALTIWQWSGDRLKLDGMYSRADKSIRAAGDFNFAMMPEMSWYEKVGFVPRSVTPPSGDTNPPSGGTEQPPASDGGMDAEAKEYLRRIMVATEKLANIIK